MHNIPLEYWTEEDLSYLASVVGVPLYADATTEACKRINFVTVCVEIDASKPLLDEFIFDIFYAQNLDINRDEITIKVSYQWKLAVCSHCHVFGHSIEKFLHSQKTVIEAPASNDQSARTLTTANSWKVVGKKGKATPSTSAILPSSMSKSP